MAAPRFDVTRNYYAELGVSENATGPEILEEINRKLATFTPQGIILSPLSDHVLAAYNVIPISTGVAGTMEGGSAT
ncbi:hypothetical protein PGQ11_003144 [Apiospora arundinis]|uniref:Uncharacterized protein n=1 Tax=Apiospora arundinis TaxID=335852 RepID=A0ABR2J4C2_9PEZI